MSSIDDIELQKQNDLKVKQQVYPEQAKPLRLIDTQSLQSTSEHSQEFMSLEDKKNASIKEIYQSRQPAFTKDPEQISSKLYKVEELPLVPNSKKSQVLFCKFCRSVVHSEVQYKTGMNTHWLAFFLFFVTLIAFFWTPYLFNRCKNAEHYCSQCNACIGVMKFGDEVELKQLKDEKPTQ